MKTLKFRPNPNSGFSLAELMVVIVIIGLLAGLVVPNVMQRFTFAQVKKAEADITAIASALEEYAIMNQGRYPDSLEQLIEPDTETGEKFLDRETLPKDPWGNEYIYYAPDSASPDALVKSLGADGAEGGDGKDSDLDNKTIKNR